MEGGAEGSVLGEHVEMGTSGSDVAASGIDGKNSPTYMKETKQETIHSEYETVHYPFNIHVYERIHSRKLYNTFNHIRHTVIYM